MKYGDFKRVFRNISIDEIVQNQESSCGYVTGHPRSHIKFVVRSFRIVNAIGT